MTGILVRGEARTCTGRLPCAQEAKAGVMGWEPEQGGGCPLQGLRVSSTLRSPHCGSSSCQNTDSDVLLF